MPLTVEEVCCRSKHRRHGLCHVVTNGDYFRRVILDTDILKLNLLSRNALFNLDADENNNSFRLAAYRQYALWWFGHLGKGNRVVLPSCAVWHIRKTFPDKSGQYVGYKPDVAR